MCPTMKEAGADLKLCCGAGFFAPKSDATRNREETARRVCACGSPDAGRRRASEDSQHRLGR